MAVVLLALPVALVGARPRPVASGRRHGGGQRAQRGRRDRPAHPALARGRVCCSEGRRQSCSSSLGQRVDALGRVTALAPTVLGAGVLLGTIAGELTARPSVGIRRSAAVETRTLGAILPRGRAVVLAVSTAAARRGAGPRRGVGVGRRPGARRPRVQPALHRRRPRASARCTWAAAAGRGRDRSTPLPLAVRPARARRARRRWPCAPSSTGPRPELDSRGLDTLLRRWSVGNVLTAATVTVLGTLGPVAVLMASALGGSACPATAVDTVAGAWSPRSSGRWPRGGVRPARRAGAHARRIRVDDLPRPLPGGGGPVGAPVR